MNDITKHVLNVLWDVPPGEQPLRPEAAAIGAAAEERPGLPHCVLSAKQPSCRDVDLEFKLIQAPRQIVVLPGNGDPARQIYMDGRSLPKGAEPSWMGSSVGRWQGETLVVETTGFKESAWLDGFGHPRSEAMHITERYRRRDFGHMDLELTFDDPKYYTQPFGFKTTLTLLPDTDVLEYVCMENQRRYRPPAP